eukprot:CAMPEP_0117760720 /NCGR_PEP_ID=MMETSP0947-20121206/16816_1 /TAXON_ID=44440 /ORGANISM="Chattonella subsalsa, Strain CCMP2191" /LENGTH=40 /DNA_ID= /DNA_START= /DNA_END= /DNA_ORIENTATION=
MSSVIGRAFLVFEKRVRGKAEIEESLRENLPRLLRKLFLS